MNNDARRYQWLMQQIDSGSLRITEGYGNLRSEWSSITNSHQVGEEIDRALKVSDALADWSAASAQANPNHW